MSFPAADIAVSSSAEVMRRKEAARAQLRDLQLETSRAGVEEPLPIPVAVRGPGRRPLVRAGTDLRFRLSVDEPLA